MESDSCWQLTVCWRAEELPLLHLIAGFSSGSVRMPVAPNQRLCLLVLVGSVTCVTQRLPCPLPSLQGSPHCLGRSFLQAATTGNTLASRNNFKITSQGKRNFQQITSLCPALRNHLQSRLESNRWFTSGHWKEPHG